MVIRVGDLGEKKGHMVTLVGDKGDVVANEVTEDLETTVARFEAMKFSNGLKDKGQKSVGGK